MSRVQMEMRQPIGFPAIGRPVPACAPPGLVFGGGGGGRCAFSISKHDAPHLLPLHFPGNRLLGARIAALGEMSEEIILYFRGKV